MRLMLAVVWFAASALAGAADDYAFIKGGEFETALKYEDTSGTVRVPPFRMMTRPVTNAEFLGFVKLHTQWQRRCASKGRMERSTPMPQWDLVPWTRPTRRLMM